MTDPSPRWRIGDAVTVITLDDGKANAISALVLDGLHAALDQAEAESRAVVITGRPGRFSAGFDLAAMTESTETMRSLVSAGARFLMRLYGFPQPTVVACTGHALAAGALMLLVADTRIGAEGEYKVGLNEVAIGMALPLFAVELARDRLTPAEFGPATMQARIYTPRAAIDAGYLDRLVAPDAVLREATAEAQRLATLRTGAYARTKQAARHHAIAHILDTLDADLADISGPDA